MDRKTYPFGFYRVEVLTQRPEMVAADGTVLFLSEEAPQPSTLLGSAIKRLDGVVRSLVARLPGASVVLQAQKVPKPDCGEMVCILDRPKMAWRALISHALQDAHERQYATVSIVLQRPSDQVQTGARRERLSLLAHEIRDAVLLFFKQVPMTKVVVVKLLVIQQPEFANALREAWTESLEAQRAPGRMAS